MKSIEYAKLTLKLSELQNAALTLYYNTLKEFSSHKFDHIILFGSIVREKFYRSSDIDLAIISDTFAGIPWTERIHLLKSLPFKTKGIVSPLGLTINEFKTFQYPSVVRTIRHEGIILKL